MKVLMALPLLALMFAGCTSEIPYVTPGMDDEGRYVIEMTSGLTYSPSHFEVPTGATVVFVNTGSVWHDITPDGHSGWAPSGQIDKGDEFVITAGEPGDYAYFCSPHVANGMAGIMRVTA